jgi:hypothetical protein
VIIWAILTMSATLSLVGIVGLLYECWKSVRASEMPYDNEPQIQQVHYELPSRAPRVGIMPRPARVHNNGL